MSLDPRVFEEAIAELTRRSKKTLYQRDFDAWSSDILGRRYFSKFRDINAQMSTGTVSRVAIKSANGCGKSMWLSDWGTYWVTAFPPEDSLAIFTANGRDQIERVVFKYLKDNYGYAKKTGNPFPGFINEQLEWKYNIPGVGNEALSFGKRPADQDIVSSFQGTRKKRTFVGMDEAGGLPQELFTAAEAVTTGEASMTVAIGNPDRRATEFHRIYTNPQLSAEWLTGTISAYDLPTMTGEIVYPNDSEKQERMMLGLTSQKWIEHKERAWRSANGKPDARFLAKVLGEFPGETDNSFFPEEDVVLAQETDIDPAGTKVVMGVDLAAMGEDESVVYVNRGGHVRQFDKTVAYKDGADERTTTGVWSKEDEVTSARRVHAIAQHLGAEEVRLDAAGLGGGIATVLYRLDEFEDKCYEVVRIVGSERASDKDRWKNNRAENHDNLKTLMHSGQIDIDPLDTALRDEMLIITYELGLRGEVVITKKRDMKSALGGSPDRLDAMIYSVIDTSALLDNPLGRLEPGDQVQMDPYEMLQLERGGAGYPI